MDLLNRARQMCDMPRLYGCRPSPPLMLCLVIGCVAASGVPQRGEFAVELSDLPGSQPPETKDSGSISTCLHIEPVQRRVEQGIGFTLEVINGTQGTVELRDSFTPDILMVRVTNAEGDEVTLPKPPSLAKVNTKDPEGFEAKWAARSPFQRIAPDPRSRVPDVKTLLDLVDGKVKLEPGERFAIECNITRVLAEPKEHKEAIRKHVTARGDEETRTQIALPRIARIPAGAYNVEVSLTLSGRVDGNEFIRRVGTTQKVGVQLGSR